MNQVLITPPQEPKETPGTRAYRVHLDLKGDQVRAGSLETRDRMEEEDRSVRRVHLESQELQDSRAPQVLQVHRVPEGSEVNQDREGSLDSLDLRVDQDQTEAREQPDAAEPTDRRANQEIQVIKEFQDHWDPEECRVRMAETVTDLQDLMVPRGILVSLVTPVYWVRTACRDQKEVQDLKGTEVELEAQAGPENQAWEEIQDMLDTRVPEVLLESKA